MRRRGSRAVRTRTWPGILFVASVVVLLVATTVVSNARFQFGEADLLHNSDFTSGLDAWRSQGPGRATLRAADMPVVRLTQPSGRGNARFSGEFAPWPSTSHVRVSAELRTRDVAKGPNPWNTGRLVVTPFDADGAFIRGRPHVLFSETGTNGWRRYDGIFPIGADVATMKIELQLLQASGAIEVRDLHVQEAFVVPELAAIHRLLGACWALLILVALIWLAKRLPKRGLWVCGALAVAMLVLTAPRPRDHVVRPVLLGGFIDAADLEAFLGPFQAAPERAHPQNTAIASPPTSAPVQTPKRPGFVEAVNDGWLAIVDLVRRYDHLDEYMHALFLCAVAVFCSAIAGYRAAGLVGTALLVLALVSEYLQVFSLGRSFSVGDAGFNLVGIAAGFALYLLGRRVILMARPAGAFGH